MLKHKRLLWSIIALLTGMSIFMAAAGIYALKKSPTLFFDSQIITLRQGIEITHLNDFKIEPTDLWKLPVFVSPHEEQRWWQAQRHFGELLKNTDRVIIQFNDRRNNSWQIAADVGHISFRDILSRISLIYIVCLIYIISALTVFRRHPTLPGFLCAIFLSSAALYLICLTPVIHRPLFLDPSWLSIFIKIFFVASTGQISIVHFAVIFPRKKRLIERHSWILWLFYAYAFAISMLYLLSLISIKTTLPLLIFWVLIMLAAFAHSMLQDQDEFMRQQTRMTFFALLLVSGYFIVSMVYLWQLEASLLENIALFSLILPFSLILSLDNRQLYLDRISIEINSRKEKERIHRELHDTVLNDLASISIVTEGALRFLKSDPALVQNRLQQIRNYTTDSSTQLRNFLWVIDDRQNTWEDIVSSLRKLGYDLLSQKNINFDIEINRHHRPVPSPSPAVKHSVYQIFRESLINISKHAEATRVLVSITFGNAMVIIVINDNGIGFDPTSIKKNSYGLKNIRQRVDEINGELVVKSRSGYGSQIVVQIPLS